jgi:peptidoglycan DL-endopeptidase CwlO
MFSHRTRVTIAAAVGIATLMTPVMFDGLVHADQISDQRTRVAQITDQLEALQQQSDTLAEDYAVAVDELNGLEAKVHDAEAAVAAKQAQVDRLQGQLGEVAVQAFMGGTSNDALGPLLGDAATFNEDLQREELTRVALNTGTADSDDLARAVSDLADEQQALQDQRDAAEQKKQEVAAAQAATEAKTKEYQSARTAAERELGNLIQQEEERRARESFERMQAQAAAAQARAEAVAAQQAQNQQRTQSANPATSGGGGSSPSNRPTTAPAPATNNNNSNNGGGAAPRPVAAPSIPAASSRAGTAINAALSQLGVSYRFAAATPGVAFDCSGLTMWAWGRAGVGLPHQSRQQYASVPHVPASAAQPGDLVFFYSPISHVGIYLGNGMMVDSPNSGAVVRRAAVNWGNVVGVGRPG